MAVLKDNSGNTAASSKFGGSSGIASRTASKFVPSGNWNLTSIDVRIEEDTGNPTGDVQIQILGDSAGSPDNANVRGTATLTAVDANVGAVFTDFNRSFAVAFNVKSGITYWIVLKVSASESDTNYYSTRAITTAGSNNGSTYSGTTWTNNTNDLFYKLNGTVIDFAPSAETQATSDSLVGVKSRFTTLSETQATSNSVTTGKGWKNQQKSSNPTWRNQSKT